MQKAEGPPFPPHVGYSIFQEENGKLVRRGERYNLARCLRYSKSKPRLLDFHAAPDFPLQKFYVSCKTAGVKLNDELTVIPQRNAKGIFTAIDYNTDSSWPPPDTSTEVITDTSLRTIDF